ncbi:hypothetical protein ACET3Z_022536 [Daucus carota]
MDADQKLMALKRAYADIILNTSKEAAARVMASERKSQQLEYELRATKEEAIQMMLRLKKMMDDKISEANRTSQNQQEKIDELEAQLQEAEDIVNERIQACERDVLDGELSLLRQTSGVISNGMEGERTDKSTCKTTTDGAEKMFNIGSEEAMHKDGGLRCGYKVQTSELIPEKVKTAPKYRINKSTLRMKNPDKLFMNVYGTPADPIPKSVENNAQPDQDPTLTAPKLSSDEASMATQLECAKPVEMNGDTDKGEPLVDILVPIKRGFSSFYHQKGTGDGWYEFLVIKKREF